MAKRTPARVIGVALTAVGGICLSPAAQAQSSPPEGVAEGQAAASGELPQGEIIVTAQKRSERLQDVPLAITAITGAALADRGITDTTHLTQVAPSLTYTQGANASNSTFRIRGIGTQVFGQGGESSVSTVIDGVVLARQGQGFTDLADIERVEVLRGPQGTLFGKNATGGVISVVTADPTQDPSGRAAVTVAQKGEYHARGTVSDGIADNVSVRLTGFYNKDDGYIRDVVSNRKTNGYESWGVRGKVMADVGALNLLASASYDKYDGQCCTQVAIRTDNAALARLQLPVVAGPNNIRVSSNLDTVSNTASQLYSLRGKYDIGQAAEVTSITAYQKWHFNNNNDIDGLNTTQPIYTGGNGSAPYYAQFDVNGGPIDLHQFSQELRLASSGQHRFNYVVGGYYEKLGLLREFTRRIVTCPTTRLANQGLAIGAICPSPLGVSGSHHADLDSEQYAGFGQVDYRVVGGLKLLAGFRVQRQTIEVTGYQNAAAPFAGDTPAFSGATLTSGTTKARDTAFTYKLGAQYVLGRNVQAYLTYGTGYKGQSVGTEYNQTFNNNPVVAPETVKAWEAGLKGSALDRKLTFAVAAFLARYRNLQVQANRSDQSTGTFLFVTTNAGHAETKGVELEATIAPNADLSLGLSAAYVHARFDADGIGCPLQNQASTITVVAGGTQPVGTCFRQANDNGTLSSAVQNVRGGILPNTPAWRLAASPRYQHDVSNAFAAFVELNLSYQSKVGFALEQDPLLVQKGYATLDLTVGARPRGGRGFNASVFVRNLTGARFYTGMAHASALTSAAITPNNLTGFLPKDAFRYAGVNLGYSF